MIKSLIVANDVNLQSAPILQLVKHLKSFYGASLERMAGEPTIARTRDLETAGGIIYLISEDEQQVKADCLFLHRVETDYPQMLLNELKATEDCQVERLPLEEQLNRIDLCNSTLVFSDSNEESEHATVVGVSQLATVYDSYEQGLLDISRQESFSDVESLLQQMSVFFDKLREGARVYIPESTYCHLPYGIEGMEIILHAAGLCIEAPLPGDSQMMVVSK